MEPTATCGRQLRSLWEIMLEFDLCKFVSLTNTLRTITHSGRVFPERVSKPGHQGDSAFLNPLSEGADHLGELGLKTSRGAVLELAKRIDSFGPYTDYANEGVGMVCRVLRLEAEGRKFLYVENDELYAKGAGLLGDDVTANFASAAFDIDEAGKCLALGRSTAAVFHLMRVMEGGIKAATACLGIPDPVKGADRNWGVMLRKIKDELDSRPKSSRPLTKQDAQFFAEIHVSLDAVRNVWRNTTMHVENKYTPEEADHILGAVRGFMKKLASRMDESGDPRA